ncbi:MAG: Hsp70 family protein [Bacillota bacterium]
MQNFWRYFPEPLKGRVIKKPVRVLGIDLGTTNSAVAEIVWEPGSSLPPAARCLEVDQETLEGRHTHPLVPSVVAIYGDKLFVGEGAKRLRAAAEKGLEQNRNLFYECKNEMGVRRTYHRAPEGFRSAAEIGGKVLRFLYEAALADDPTLPDRVVVTVPASFQLAQRRDTLEAARLAGLTLTEGDLLDEPLAAFMDYLLSGGHEPPLAPGEAKNLVVFDFGGGTCDVAVFRLSLPLEGGSPRVAFLSVSRYYRLGGGDIDRAIVYEVLLPELLKQNDLGAFALSFAEKRRLEPVLLGAAENLKIGLSVEIARLKAFSKYAAADKSSILQKDPCVHSCKLGKRTLVLRNPQLTAQQFEALLAPFLDRDLLYARETEYRLTCSVFAPLQDALERAGLDPEEVDFCLMVGGSSLIPQVIEAVAEFFPAGKVLTHPDRESWQTTVARGAAYQALALALTGRGFIQPVCHDDIKIRTTSGLRVLVPRGAELPYPSGGAYAECSGLAVPAAVSSGSLDLRVEIVAGEEDRVLLSEIWDIYAPAEKGEPLCLKYRYDTNQILELELFRAGGERQGVFHARLEKPLTNVVNPDAKRLRIYEMEEELKDLTVKKAADHLLVDKLVELAEAYADLKQYEKAINLLKAALQKKRGPDAAILNKLGIYCGELGDFERQEKFYREAAAATTWGGPWFNLALAQKGRGQIAAAVESVEKALAREREAPYLVLRAQLAEAEGKTGDYERYLEEALRAFGPVTRLTEWELGWFLTAARLAGDDGKIKEAQAEMKRRRRGLAPGGTGYLPDLRPETAGGATE